MTDSSASARVSDPADGLFRIAAVSNLTGIPVPTIRIWEFRYQAVQPARSGGNSRLYSPADVDRLRLLKAVVDAGFQIGTIAALGNEQLRERLQSRLQPVRPSTGKLRSAIVCGDLLGARLGAGWQSREDIAVAAVITDIDALPTGLPAAEVLIVDLPTLAVVNLQSLRRLRSTLRPELTIVIYGYANRRTLEQLDDEGVIALGAPVDPVHLARICRLGLASDSGVLAPIERLLREPAATRRYDLAFLGTLRDLPTQVQCECPNHLAELLTRLNAFEQYSLSCESRNQRDARLHARLFSAAAHCREVLEQVLGEVLDHEGIAQPGVGSSAANAHAVFDASGGGDH